MTRIRITAGGVGVNFLPVYVAKRQGLFLKNGIDIETPRPPSVDKAAAPIVVGGRSLS